MISGCQTQALNGAPKVPNSTAAMAPGEWHHRLLRNRGRAPSLLGGFGRGWMDGWINDGLTMAGKETCWDFGNIMKVDPI